MITETRYQRVNALEFCQRYSSEPEELNSVARLICVTKIGPWLVGGSVRRQMTNVKQASDFDVGIADVQQLELTSSLLTNAKFSMTHDTTFYRQFEGELDSKHVKIQLLKVVFGEVEKILGEFDFTLCQTAYDGTDFILGPYTMWDIGQKHVSVNKISFAASSVRRLIKYSKQGYFACQGCVVEILETVAKDRSTINAKVDYVD